jgi:hypothetical protein
MSVEPPGARAFDDDARRRYSAIERLALAGPAYRKAYFRGWSDERMERFWAGWASWARPSQRPPEGPWRVWLLMAGRGFGKTRAGAEWVCGPGGEWRWSVRRWTRRGR